ncbi:MAG: hypothetical protein COB84_05725 [Rhodobacteraceae bacterium]|nr:MAG: hypothetical protein COB84_05725 [Paracoccaceae bacterium]
MATKKKTTTVLKKTTKLKPAIKTTAPVISDTADQTTADMVDATAPEEAVKVVDPNMIKKKDIYDHVTITTGLRKREVREAVDCLLEYFHECLSDGKNIQAPPLGKIRAVEQGSGENTKMVYKLKLKSKDDGEKKVI